MYDMKKDAPKEDGMKKGKGPTTGHMGTKMHTVSMANYKYGAAGQVGLYLKDMGRSKGY